MTTLEQELSHLIAKQKERPWERLYSAAVQELNPARLNKRVESALSAIQHRLNALATRLDGKPTAEHHALADVVDQLRMLQRARVRL